MNKPITARSKMGCMICTNKIEVGDEITFYKGEEPPKERVCHLECAEEVKNFSGTGKEDLDI